MTAASVACLVWWSLWSLSFLSCISSSIVDGVVAAAKGKCVVEGVVEVVGKGLGDLDREIFLMPACGFELGSWRRPSSDVE